MARSRENEGAFRPLRIGSGIKCSGFPSTEKRYMDEHARGVPRRPLTKAPELGMSTSVRNRGEPNAVSEVDGSFFPSPFVSGSSGLASEPESVFSLCLQRTSCPLLQIVSQGGWLR